MDNSLTSRLLVLISVSLMSIPALSATNTQQSTPAPKSAPHTYPVEGGHHGKLVYDPTGCADDPRGMVYFAVGKRVFRQPIGNLFDITAWPTLRRPALPTPMDPLDPEGCPGHPIQEEVYHLRPFSTVSDTIIEQPATYADYVNVDITDLSDGWPVRTEDGAFNPICANRDESVPGFVACNGRFRCNLGVVYKTTDYLTPDGSKLTLLCQTGIHCEKLPYKCGGGYRLHADTSVYFVFATTSVPVEAFIDTDRELRHRFESAEVKAYAWCCETP